MKLSISNIAWAPEEQKKFLSLIKKRGCEGLEIAAGLLWPNPIETSKAIRLEFRKEVEHQGLSLCALQALLFGQNHLKLFQDKATDAKAAEYLKGLCQLAADLGAKALVFGSPKNRERKDLSLDQAFEKASVFFKQVAPAAADLGVFVCIEPLRVADSDFINTAEEGVRLIEMVAHPGFALHLDGAAINEEKGDLAAVIKKSIRHLKHFHVSEPDLNEVGTNKQVRHSEIAAALNKAGYQGFVSIEMRKTDDCQMSVPRSIDFVKEKYIAK